MSKLSFNIPGYLSIENHKKISSLEHLSQLDKMITVIATLTDLQEDKVRELQTNDISGIYTKVLESLVELTPEFYPIIEIEGQLYGYTPISKMNLGAYADIERLAQHPLDNLEEILAILYRPILKHRFNSIKWHFKHNFKLAIGETENLFNYYEVEKYDNSTRQERAEMLAKYLPATFGLGALSFFLQVGNIFSISSPISSLPKQKDRRAMVKKTLEMIKATPFNSIGGGLQLFITSRQLPSLTSQGIKLSQI